MLSRILQIALFVLIGVPVLLVFWLGCLRMQFTDSRKRKQLFTTTRCIDCGEILGLEALSLSVQIRDEVFERWTREHPDESPEDIPSDLIEHQVVCPSCRRGYLIVGNFRAVRATKPASCSDGAITSHFAGNPHRGSLRR